MNWDHIEGSWSQFYSRIQQQWGKLTIKQIEKISGKRDLLSIKIQDAYCIQKITADQQIDAWQERQTTSAYLIERATERNGAPQ